LDNAIQALAESKNGHSSPTTLHADNPQTLTAWILSFLSGRGGRRLEAFPLVALEKNSPAQAQYKILREQIRKLCTEGRPRSLAITSPIKGDGKTTVAANLAAAMALDYEQQVLLIDADLRSPAIHSFFNINKGPGLAEYLTSKSDADFTNYVQNTSVHGLQILPAGKATSFSSELLSMERMKALIEAVSTRFPNHQIIVDTSPVLSTPDPLVLARHVDGIVMVVRAGKTPRDCLSEAIKSLGSTKILGVVLNGAELGPASKYYYYYH
jgi:capsular exopolysaccharide synthesis family protein